MESAILFRKFSPPLACCLLAALLAGAPAAPAQPQAAQDINAPYRQPDMDVDTWVQRFESEGREVYDFRHEITAAAGLEVGMDVADVGAGTGLFEPLFAQRVGRAGTVYAVDIAPDFIRHISEQAAQRGLDNIKPVLSNEHSIELPAGSVDLVFICDAYHHFEYVGDMLASIRSALRPGGQLILVEYDKQAGAGGQWLNNHIRATKEEFSAEIEANGFTFDEEIPIEGLKQTFMRRFRKR